MAEAKRDANRVPTILGVDNGDLTTPAKIAVDPATGRMLVTAVVTAGATTATEYTEGDVDASFSGVMLLGEAPGNVAKPFAVDADGNLQISATIAGYTEDAAAPANPEGTALAMVRDDGLAGSLTTTDGDIVMARGNNKGELYVKHTDSVAVTNAGLTELAGAINASAQMDVNLAGSGITVAISHAALTELAGAINASAQVDVNIAASGATVAISHAALTELAAAIDTEVQVDVVGALPAGTNDIGRVGHNITGMGHGVTTVTTAGTDVALAASTACKRVTVQAQTDNTGKIAVGATGVDATVATGNGILLNAGDAYEFEIDNLADVFIDATVNGEGVRYVYFT